jgi:hypothetical protein
MFSRNYNSSPPFENDRFNGDAIEGFSAIAAALDGGMVETVGNGGKISDALAIGLGWLVLVSVIFYPSLQLAAIVICGGFMCTRSLIHSVIGIRDRFPSAQLRGDEPSFLAT